MHDLIQCPKPCRVRVFKRAIDTEIFSDKLQGKPPRQDQRNSSRVCSSASCGSASTSQFHCQLACKRQHRFFHVATHSHIHSSLQRSLPHAATALPAQSCRGQSRLNDAHLISLRLGSKRGRLVLRTSAQSGWHSVRQKWS